MMNSYAGGPYQQALSGLSNLNNNWYNGKEYAQYSFYYQPGGSGKIIWTVADEPVWKFDARAVGPNGNIGQRVIPQEPMAMIMNFGMSTGFSVLNLTGIATTLPATMRFDYVRIYQPSGSSSITCDPSGYETTDYISKHINAYTNPNKTHWYILKTLPPLLHLANPLLQVPDKSCLAQEFLRRRLLAYSLRPFNVPVHNDNIDNLPVHKMLPAYRIASQTHCMAELVFLPSFGLQLPTPSISRRTSSHTILRLSQQS